MFLGVPPLEGLGHVSRPISFIHSFIHSRTASWKSETTAPDNWVVKAWRDARGLSENSVYLLGGALKSKPSQESGENVPGPKME